MNDKKIVHEEQADWVSVAEQQKQLAKMEGAFVDEERNATLMIGKRLGRKEMVQSLIKLLTVSDLLDLNHIKESKAYKGYRHIDDNQKLLIVSTWDDYCRIVEGRSRQIIDEELLNLKVLGPELFDSLRSIGIGSGIMRDIRALPVDDQVIIAEVAKTDDKNALMDIVHEMSLKHERDKKKLQQDKATLEKRVTELEAETIAKDEVLTKKNEKIDALDTELTKRNQLVLTPDAQLLEQQAREHEVLLDLQHAQNDVLLAFQQFHVAIDAIQQSSYGHHFDEAIQNTLNFVYQNIASISHELGVAIDFVEMVSPAWVQAAKQEMGE